MRVLLPFTLLITACSSAPVDPCAAGGPLPDSWQLATSGGTIEIARSPYRVTVRDASGKTVLAGAGDGAGDGYGSLGWTSGETAWGTIVSAGYTTFDYTLDPWRDQLRAVAVEKTSADRLDLTLSGGGRCVHVSHQLTGSRLRVEARADGDAPRAWSAAFTTPPDEAFLGLGERYHKVDHRGTDLYSWPEEGGLSKGEKMPASPTNPWPNGWGMTYYPVPFLLSTEGYGFWLDSTWRNEWNLASARPDRWRVWHIGPTLAYEVYLPLPADARPWPYHVIDQFTERTGRPMIPPAWSFGPRRRININAQVNGVLELEEMRNQDLAISIADDAGHFLPYGGDLPRTAELKAWTAQGRALGYRMFAYYNPYFVDEPTANNYADTKFALDHKYFLANAAGEPQRIWLISGRPVTVFTIDVTNPEAVAWYGKQFDRALDDGYSGWMYDFGEYVAPDVVAKNGMTGEELHNHFPVLYDKAVYDALEAGPHKGDWYAFARSGYTGSQQWTPMVWSGDPDASFSDAEGIPAQVRAGINLSLSGVAHWGSDIGGFKCLADGGALADGEMLTRWIELGSMCSNMHDEDACSGGMGKATIWSSPDAKAAWSTYARLHTRMQPYYLALAEEAHATGAPVIRHLYLEHPTLPFAPVEDAYYLGPALLVAPVVKRGARDRTLALPPGYYLDWRDQLLLDGGATVTLSAPLDKLPLLLRDGHLLPLLDPSIDTLAEESSPSIVGPTDVQAAYDVVALLSTKTGAARFTFTGGSTLDAKYTSAFAPPALPPAADEADLATCNACWRRDPLSPRLTRIRITTPDAQVTAGGLTLSSKTTRTTRWDLYLVE